MRNGVIDDEVGYIMIGYSYTTRRWRRPSIDVLGLIYARLHIFFAALIRSNAHRSDTNKRYLTCQLRSCTQKALA